MRAVNGLKVCTICKEEKSVEEFYYRKAAFDKLRSDCKKCTDKRSILFIKNKLKDPDYREKYLQHKKEYTNSERGREVGRKRHFTEKRKEWVRSYRSKIEVREKMRRATNNWKAENPEKRKAHSLVEKACRSGKLHRKPCCVCGESVSIAHHEDYSKPFDIIWLCSKHHNSYHAGLVSLDIPAVIEACCCA